MSSEKSNPFKDMPNEAYQIMEKRDEEQILAEIKGEIIDEMFYEMTISGKKVTGISWVGTKEVARRYGQIKMGQPTVQDLGESYAASIQATDLRNDVTLVGSSVQSKTLTKKTGEVVDDSFAYTKAISKAQRNAIRALIPEKFLIEMYHQYKKGDMKDAPVYRESTVDVKEVPDAPVRPDKQSLLNYFEEAGYDPKRFTIHEDEPTGLVTIKIKGFIKGIRPVMENIPAYWNPDYKCYEVNM